MSETPVLELDDLRVDYRTPNGMASAVAGVSFAIRPGEIFGLVGESGCGKTTLGTALLRLLPQGAQVGGGVRFEGRDLLTLSQEEMRQLRGDRMSVIVQNPLSSLDPVVSVGRQIAETILAHRAVSRRDARAEAVELLRAVGIREPERRYDDPPHRFSGGMRQRVVTAIALANKPSLVIADEPTTALDVTIQKEILGLLQRRCRELGTAVLLITHDLGVVAQLCDRVGVMYAGQLAEIGPARELLDAPRHPYTRMLLEAVPSMEQEAGALRVIPGEVPDAEHPPPGCRFVTRCPHRMDVCDGIPPCFDVGEQHGAACWLNASDAAVADPATARQAS